MTTAAGLPDIDVPPRDSRSRMNLPPGGSRRSERFWSFERWPRRFARFESSSSVLRNRWSPWRGRLRSPGTLLPFFSPLTSMVIVARSCRPSILCPRGRRERTFSRPPAASPTLSALEGRGDLWRHRFRTRCTNWASFSVVGLVVAALDRCPRDRPRSTCPSAATSASSAGSHTACSSATRSSSRLDLRHPSPRAKPPAGRHGG